MKIGITFGAYCPLHQGHLDLIMRAKNENDKCVVIVGGRRHDRGGELLPLEKRFALVKRLFQGDQSIIVGLINNSELGIDGSKTLANWKIWLQKVRDILEENNLLADTYVYTWYVAEALYAARIREICGEPVVLLDRQSNAVSGSKCRSEPFRYWRKITWPFRPFYTETILVTGFDTRKTDLLAADVGRYYSLVYTSNGAAAGGAENQATYSLSVCYPIFLMSADLPSFWQSLCSGTSAVSRVKLNKVFTLCGSFDEYSSQITIIRNFRQYLEVKNVPLQMLSGDRRENFCIMKDYVSSILADCQL